MAGILYVICLYCCTCWKNSISAAFIQTPPVVVLFIDLFVDCSSSSFMILFISQFIYGKSFCMVFFFILSAVFSSHPVYSNRCSPRRASIINRGSVFSQLCFFMLRVKGDCLSRNEVTAIGLANDWQGWTVYDLLFSFQFCPCFFFFFFVLCLFWKEKDCISPVYRI